MKKFIVAFILCLSAFSAFAQVYVSSGNPDVDIKIKRAFSSGSDVVIDFLVTSSTIWESITFGTLPANDIGVLVYDDEGNLYDNKFTTQKYAGSRIWFESDGERSYQVRNVKIARNIPRKVRMIIQDVDEYASSFSEMTIGYYGNNDGRYAYKIIIKNLPITRE